MSVYPSRAYVGAPRARLAIVRIPAQLAVDLARVTYGPQVPKQELRLAKQTERLFSQQNLSVLRI